MRVCVHAGLLLTRRLAAVPRVRTATMVCQQDTEFMVLNKEAFKNVIGIYYEQQKREQMNFLKQFSFFNKIGNSKMLSLMNSFKVNTYHPKSIVYSQNEPVKNIYFIRRGEVEIEQVEEIGEQLAQEVLSKQTLQQQISLKNRMHSMNASQKQKQQTVSKIRIPIIRLGENTFFGDYEVLNKHQYRQQFAICTQLAEIYVIEKKVGPLGRRAGATPPRSRPSSIPRPTAANRPRAASFLCSRMI